MVLDLGNSKFQKNPIIPKLEKLTFWIFGMTMALAVLEFLEFVFGIWNFQQSKTIVLAVLEFGLLALFDFLEFLKFGSAKSHRTMETQTILLKCKKETPSSS